MKFFIPMMVVVLASPLLQAQTFNVKRVKGKQAIIQLTSGTFSEGQSVTVGGGGDSSMSMSSGSGSTGPRNNFLGFDMGFSTAKAGTVTLTSLNLNVKYGWNSGSIEYGVLGAFGSTSGGTESISSFGVGGMFDYNFSENRVGNDGIFLVGVQATYGTRNPGSATNITIFPAVGYKWFILGTPTCLRFDAGMQIVQTSVGGVSTSDTQPNIVGGLQTYF